MQGTGKNFRGNRTKGNNPRNDLYRGNLATHIPHVSEAIAAKWQNKHSEEAVAS